MRKILLLPCLLFTISTICQTQPTLKNVKTTTVSNKNELSSSLQKPLNKITEKRVRALKKSSKKLTLSKPTDHLLDLKNEPE